MTDAEKIQEQKIKDWQYEYAKCVKFQKNYGDNRQLIEHLKTGRRSNAITQEFYDAEIIKYGKNEVAEVLIRKLRDAEDTIVDLCRRVEALEAIKVEAKPVE